MRTAPTTPLPRSCHINSAGRTQPRLRRFLVLAHGRRHAAFINGRAEASINADPLSSGLVAVLCQSTAPKRLKRGRQILPSWPQSPSTFMKCQNGPSRTPGRMPSTFINHQALSQHGAHGVVVSHPLRMRKALGSNPSVSMFATCRVSHSKCLGFG